LAEKVDQISACGVSREELISFTEQITDENPNISFDWHLMNSFSNKDLWFIEIM